MWDPTDILNSWRYLVAPTGSLLPSTTVNNVNILNQVPDRERTEVSLFSGFYLIKHTRLFEIFFPCVIFYIRVSELMSTANFSKLEHLIVLYSKLAIVHLH